jgi:DNA topoisomerase VI subunit B
MGNHFSRETFQTSRLLEFTNRKELVTQIGHDVDEWVLVVVKEIVENAMDEAEEEGLDPVIDIVVRGGEMIFISNGRFDPKVVPALADYAVRVSSREAYVAPTRGQQGNALQTIFALLANLDEVDHRSITTIESWGVAHHITFQVDPVRQTPVTHYSHGPSKVKDGTCITVRWPTSASSILKRAQSEILLFVDRYEAINPHLTIHLEWDGEVLKDVKGIISDWPKWKPSDKTPAHWYSLERFERLMAVHIARDEDLGRDQTVREWIAQFRGFTGSPKRTEIMADSRIEPHTKLREFYSTSGTINHGRIDMLRQAMIASSDLVEPAKMGIIGKDYLRSTLVSWGGEENTFQYKRLTGETVDGLPYMIEAAFVWTPDWKGQGFFTGINFAPAIDNPFRDAIDQFLGQEHAGADEDIAVVVHLACPQVYFSNRGKSAAELPEEIQRDLLAALNHVIAKWSKIRKAEERDVWRKARRAELLASKSNPKTKIRHAAEAVIEQAYLEASSNGTLPAHARQIMYAARRLMLARDPEQKMWARDSYFTQDILPAYVDKYGKEEWDVVFDGRGHFHEPHTGRAVALGTLEVRRYLKSIGVPHVQGPVLASANVVTGGPEGRFGGVMFVEKEGFWPLFEAVRLADRLDLAIMSTKGMSVTASRKLVDHLCGKLRIPLFVLRDFDKSGFSILGTLTESSKRYRFSHKVIATDLGLRLADVQSLRLDGERVQKVAKEVSREKVIDRLRRHGATNDELRYLLGPPTGEKFISGRRVELNALSSTQLIELVERKLTEGGVRKVVPNGDLLRQTYEAFVTSKRLEGRFADLKAEAERMAVDVPGDLETRVRCMLDANPTMRWDEAVAKLAINDDDPAGKAPKKRKW